MPGYLWPLLITFVFFIANLLVMWTVLKLNRRPRTLAPQLPPRPEPAPADLRNLSAGEILGWEFEYARTTASEAMQDRHTMVNFYLLAAGIVATGVLAVLSGEPNLPPLTGTILLWLLCAIGWLYLLKLIRLRQSWHDSALAMNQIKSFYLQHSQDFQPDQLQAAFRWQPDTLPPPDRGWNVFAYSAALIGLLDSVALVAGGALLDLPAVLAHPAPTLGLLALLGLAFFAFHLWYYFAFLKLAK